MTTDTTALLSRLRDHDRDVRARAAIELGKEADRSALESLLEALSAERDPFVRENVTWAVARLGDAALPHLVARLDDPRPQIRHDAAHALGKIALPAAVDPLIALLLDPEVTVVAKAAYALGQIGDPRAVPALVALVGSESRVLESTLVAVLGGFGREAFAPLVAALGSGDARTREHAADLLRTLGDDRALPALAPLLRDASWRVRFAAVNAIGELGGAIALLAGVTNDPDARVRALVRTMATRVAA
ncbi:MAG: HEAT repeat domain-containing protein [Bauldia sp.]